MFSVPVRVLLLCCLLALGCKESGPSGGGAASASASASATAPPLKRVRFVHEPVHVGQRWRRQRRSRMKISVEFFTETSRWATTESLREEIVDVTDEILARVGSWPGKVRATYKTHHVVEEHPDRGKRDDHLLEGKTYVLDRIDKQPVTTDAQGNEVSQPEFDALWSHHSQLGKEDELISLLTQRPIPTGRKYPLKVFMFNALLGAEMGEYEKGTFSVSRVREESGEQVATLSWNAVVKSKEDNGMVMDWELRGETHVALKPARLVSQDIEAQISISGRTRKDATWLRIEGAGSMKDHREQAILTYEPGAAPSASGSSAAPSSAAAPAASAH